MPWGNVKGVRRVRGATILIVVFLVGAAGCFENRVITEGSLGTGGLGGSAGAGGGGAGGLAAAGGASGATPAQRVRAHVAERAVAAVRLLSETRSRRSRARSLVPVDGASRTAPAGDSEPGSGSSDRTWFAGPRARAHPPLEPWAGAARIDRGRGAEVLPEVEQHVDHSDPHLARGGEPARVVPIRPDGARAACGAVDGPRAADGQPLKAAPERQGDVRFDEQVHVIGLDREVNHPKRAAARRRERGAQLGKHRGGPERRDVFVAAERDVDGVSHVVLGPSSVRDTGATAGGLAAGAATTAAPLWRFRERELTRAACHVEWALIGGAAIALRPSLHG